MSESEVPGVYFPPYCSGSALILTPEVARRGDLEFARNQTHFWIDDAFFTGILAKRTDVGHVKLNDRYSLQSGEWERQMLEESRMFAHVSGSVRVRHETRRSLWDGILKRWGDTDKTPVQDVVD